MKKLINCNEETKQVPNVSMNKTNVHNEVRSLEITIFMK